MLDVNAFEIRGNIRALFPFTAMMNASCSPNTQNSIDSNWLCRVRAARDIAKGEECFICYGQRCNWELLLNYGFVVADNPFDFVTLEVPERVIRRVESHKDRDVRGPRKLRGNRA